MTTSQDRGRAVRQIMPAAIDNLKRLVRIPSIATDGYPLEPVLEAARLTTKQLESAGFQSIRQLQGLDGGYPAIFGEIPGPPGTPTVLLYAHYDVQPSGPTKAWESSPFEPTERNGRLYGRGSADDKSAIAAHVATMQVFEGRPPVGVKIIVEGDEEFGGSLDTFIPQHPELFSADVVIVCDHGNLNVGEPTLTTSLRGSVSLSVEVRTLTDKQHNGVFGGPVPDALIALCQMIATFHDANGNVHIPGLEPGDWQGADVPEAAFRRAATLLPGIDLVGDRPLSARLWAGYAINVIGLDAPRTEEASNSLIDAVKARLNLRVPPGQDAARALELLIQHLKRVVPWHAQLVISDAHAANGFIAQTDGPAYVAAREALKEAYQKEVQIIGDGASIPLTTILSEQFPQAEIIIWGAEDLAARIHGPNESVDLEELERLILAQALFLEHLAQK